MPKKILVVDDDRVLSNTTAEVLRQHGYEVVAAYDGYQSLRLAHELVPSLIILDIRMPAGGGLTVYKNLKASYDTQNIPIIFTSGVEIDDVAASISPRDVKNFVRKPYDMANLLERVEKLIGI